MVFQYDAVHGRIRQLYLGEFHKATCSHGSILCGIASVQEKPLRRLENHNGYGDIMDGAQSVSKVQDVEVACCDDIDEHSSF